MTYRCIAYLKLENDFLRVMLVLQGVMREGRVTNRVATPLKTLKTGWNTLITLYEVKKLTKSNKRSYSVNF